MYPEEFNLCDVDNIPRFGNLSNIFPMNWRFLTTLDPQVDVALSRDLDSPAIQCAMDAVNEFLNSSKLVHVMRDNPYHNVPILRGMHTELKYYMVGVVFIVGNCLINSTM